MGELDFVTLWLRLDAALLQYAPLLRRSLRQPLAPADAAAAWVGSVDTNDVGIAAAYRTHDGARHCGGIFTQLPVPAELSWVRMTCWLTTGAARDELARLTTTFVTPGEAHLFPIGRLHPYRFEAGYESTEQCCLAVDTVSGELLAVSYYECTGPAKVTPLGITWAAYLHDLLRALTAGQLGDYRDDYNVLHLQPRAKPLPAVRSRSDAEVLLQILCERNLLSLPSPPSPQLLHEVGKALRKRAATARLAALRDVFADSPEVDEDYADDDALEALIELVRQS